MIESPKTLKRIFSIGDEWLYYKLYCGSKTADEILINVIKPVTYKLLKKNIIDKWFFIRYSDSNLHLRVRFHYNNPENIFNIISLVNIAAKTYIENDLIWKVQIDTYKREIERYGSNSIGFAEELFFYDSEMIVNMIDMIDGEEGEIVRWLFAVRAIDSFLEDFSFNEFQKFKLLENLKNGFGREFGMNKNLKIQLDKKFRNERQKIIDVLNKNNDSKSEMKPLFDLITKKSISVKPLVLNILHINNNNKSDYTLDNLMGSYIHMSMNRIFKSKQRMHEMVIYDLLFKYYKSEIAKKKYKPQLQ